MRAPSRPTSQRRAQDDDRDTETREPLRKRRRTTNSATLSDYSIIEDEEPTIVRTEDAASEDESCASLVETALCVSAQVDLSG